MESVLLLLDEPFKGLDSTTKEQMYQLLLNYWHTHKPTVLLVTHDEKEAERLSHRIVHLSGNHPVHLLEEVSIIR
ncbi:hypothetical protein [Bacillus sp. FJAT-50079]|uniref:hypothetical protein n=1 Tax=Bacillus sp. FJAT-50079 TaxID=2833577 RepID=UPI001BC9D288|nr:hypothetical protein [Bacillus sp. FJAT-50079]MBS4207102.1 hypothetical protein [Bacillus sp. FJAT-50079]